MSTSIQWTDHTWNCVVGCSRVSAGCDHCYAMGVAHRKMSPQHVGLTKLRPKDAERPGVDWNGTVRFLPERLAEPLRMRKGKRIFVNSMSDLFHESLPFEEIAAVFGVMAASQRHTFQVLTKRPKRARQFFAWLDEARQFTNGSCAYTNADYCGGSLFEAAQGHIADLELLDLGKVCYVQPWPLPNVHLGVSVEDQATADERIPILLQLPAAVRWVSYEPALGPVDFRYYLGCARCGGEGSIEVPGGGTACPRCFAWRQGSRTTPPFLDWIVVGGESGSRARSFDVAWARSVVAYGRAAGTPVFVKQLGSRPGTTDYPEFAVRGGPMRIRLDDSTGGDWGEWTGPLANLRVREFPRQPQP